MQVREEHAAPEGLIPEQLFQAPYPRTGIEQE
jgi:hypothetical protein